MKSETKSGAIEILTEYLSNTGKDFWSRGSYKWKKFDKIAQKPENQEKEAFIHKYEVSIF